MNQTTNPAANPVANPAMHPALSSDRRPSTGLSLLELIVCMALLAIVVCYALPSYQTYRMRAYRADAASALFRAAHYVETQAADGAWQTGVSALPVDLAQAPSAGPAAYAVTLAPADADNGGYTLNASPLPDGPMGSDTGVCGDFVLDATGRRANRIAGALRDDRVALCWDGRAVAQTGSR